MMYKQSLTLLISLIPGALAADPGFTPVDIPAHAYTGGWEHFVGGGMAVFDCNGDQFPELYVAGGTSKAELMVNTTANRGAAISFAANTPDTLALDHVSGAYPLDIDGDGILDLAILRVGENMLMKGEGNCSFSPFPASLGFSTGDRWTTSFSATWEDGQSLPSFVFGNYVDRSNPDGPFFACDTNYLYRPESSVYSRPIGMKPGFCALSALFTDWNRAGRADLRVSNDRQYYVKGGEEQLWAMEDTPRLYGHDEGWKPYSLWGMGIASRDVNGDGLPDVFLSTMADQRLQLREGDGPTYMDAPYSMGATAQRPSFGDDGRPSTGWTIAFGDVDLDGRDDVFIAKGNVEQMPSNAMEDPNTLLMQSEDGSFHEMALDAGVASLARSRGAALADLNLDGRLDLAVVNRKVAMEIYQNTTLTQGHWLELQLAQPGPDGNAVGAWIDMKVGDRMVSREITVGGAHATGVALPEHFGLGAADHVSLRVTWPDGQVSDWVETGVDQILRASRDGSSISLEKL